MRYLRVVEVHIVQGSGEDVLFLVPSSCVGLLLLLLRLALGLTLSGTCRTGRGLSDSGQAIAEVVFPSALPILSQREQVSLVHVEEAHLVVIVVARARRLASEERVAPP
jgi:hypothetical protein